MKAILLAACVIATVLLPAGSGFPVHASQPAHQAQSPHRCQNVQLLIRYHASNGAAGTIGVVYRIHNVSGHACSLFGYPGVQLLDRNFVSLPTTVIRGGSFLGGIPERSVVLSAHDNAYFTLSYSDVPVGNQPCQAPAKYLMIFAPNDLLPVVTYAFGSGGSISVCTGTVHVSPVTAQPRLT